MPHWPLVTSVLCAALLTCAPAWADGTPQECVIMYSGAMCNGTPCSLSCEPSAIPPVATPSPMPCTPQALVAMLGEVIAGQSLSTENSAVDINSIPSVYIVPLSTAEQLRQDATAKMRQADMIEARDALLRRARALVRDCGPATRGK